MFIIWGNYHRQEPLGVVADHCDACDRVSRFAVVKHFDVSHLYFIPLGRGRATATARECFACGAAYHAHLQDYDCLLPEHDAEELSLSELLEQSNSRLQRARQARAKLEQKVQSRVQHEGADVAVVVPVAVAEDPRWELAKARLLELDDLGEHGHDLLYELAEWERLSSAEQDRLLKRVDRHLDEHEQSRAACAFLHAIAGRSPRFAGGVPLLLLVAAVGSAFIFLPMSRTLLGIAAVAVAAITGFLLIGFYSQWRMRRWFVRELIPQAEQRGVDLEILAALLAGVDPADTSIDQNIRDLALEHQSLRDVIGAREFSMLPG